MSLNTLIAELEEAERKNALRAKRVADAIAGKYRIPYDEEQQMRLELDAYESLLWRHRNTLIEALKRQGEALSHIVSIGEAHGSNYDFERILDMRDIARAALTAHKEKSDV